jgi:FKBP-type peptidyl-prolyl cis-trans isomerase FklB
MKNLFLSAVLLSAALSASAQVKKPVKPLVAKTVAKPATAAVTANVLKNAVDSASYALGYRIAQNLKSQGLDPLNLDILQKGMSDALQVKQPLVANESLDMCIGVYQQKNGAKKGAVARKAGQEFLATNSKRKEVVTLPSGMQYEILKAGTSTVKPTLANEVTCHYHGTVINGDIFDSSVDRGEPATFPLNGVIKGWQEALQLMTVGSKWKLYIPADLAYGDQQKGDKILPGSLLIFEVELISVK